MAVTRKVVRKQGMPGPGVGEFVAGMIVGGFLMYLLQRYRIEVRVVRR